MTVSHHDAKTSHYDSVPMPGSTRECPLNQSKARIYSYCHNSKWPPGNKLTYWPGFIQISKSGGIYRGHEKPHSQRYKG